MAMAIDQAGQNRFALRVDDFCTPWNIGFTASSYFLDAPVLKDNDGILNGWTSGSVDQEASNNGDRPRLGIQGRSENETDEQTGKDHQA
jgi:hypothetical protein